MEAILKDKIVSAFYMDEATKQNWEKIRAHLESIGEMNNMFYKRAVAICADKPDPLEPPKMGDES